MGTLDSYIKKLEPLLTELGKKIRETNRKVSDIAGEGLGLAEAKQLLNLKKDFRGIYVFVENRKAMYVGISRFVLRRIQQHVKGPYPSAPLACRMLRKANGSSTLSKNMGNPKFKKDFKEAQEKILSWDLAFRKIDDDNLLEDDNLLYLLEFAAAVRFDTLKYNSFRTH